MNKSVQKLVRVFSVAAASFFVAGAAGAADFSLAEQLLFGGAKKEQPANKTAENQPDAQPDLQELNDLLSNAPVEDLGPYTLNARIVNRRTDDLEQVTFARGDELIVDDMVITTSSCVPNHGQVAGNYAVYLNISSLDGRILFNGWLFSKFPGVTSIQQPKFDLLVEKCTFNS